MDKKRRILLSEQIAKNNQLVLIEDAAQAIGAHYPMVTNGTVIDKPAGSMGLCGCFSFFPSKNLGGIGDGGMVVTQDKEIAQQLTLLQFGLFTVLCLTIEN